VATRQKAILQVTRVAVKVPDDAVKIVDKIRKWRNKQRLQVNVSAIVAHGQVHH